MNVALITNQSRTTGSGRYAFTLQEHIRKDVNADLYFINYENYTLELTDFSGKENNQIAHVDRHFFYDNALLSKLRVSKLLLCYRLLPLINKNYEIYHFTGQTVNNSIYSRKIRADNNCVKLVTAHDLFREKGLERNLPKKIVFRGISQVDAVICTSEYTKKEIQSTFRKIEPSRIKVIYEGVDREIFRPLEESQLDEVRTKYGIPEGGYILMHVGKPLQRKNTKTVIKVLNELVGNKGLKNICLIKIGQWDNESAYLIEKYQLKDYIISLQNIPETDLPKLYNLADVFIFPSYAEGFGFPVLEAISCGVPVVASNRTAVPEIIGSAGVTLDPDDVKGFAENINEILKNDTLAKKYQTDGLRRAKIFSWEKVSDETLNFYKELTE